MRWRTFSLRTLLILVTGIAVWLGYCVNSANKQRRAVEVIAKDGYVVYYHEFPFPFESTNPTEFEAEPPGPKWLRKIIGDDYFRTVRQVHFTPNEASVAKLKDLPEVDLLFMRAYRLKDEDFKNLKRYFKT